MPVANPKLVHLLSEMGGRQAAVDAMNQVKELAGDASSVITLRQVNNWVYGDAVPAIGRFYLLVAAAYLGISPARAARIFEPLEATSQMVRMVARAGKVPA